MDEPLVIVDRYGTRTWLHSDERGSVIAGSNAAGAASHINTYDEYGRGGGSNAFRFGFTGQVRLAGDRHYYKARMYDPGLGRFLQPDPIGYGGGMNMYAYVKGDPVNFTDPSGLCSFRGWAHFEAPQGPDGNPSGPWKHTGNTWESSGYCGGTPAARFMYDAPIEPGGGGGEAVKCKLGNGAINVSFDGTTLNITAKINLVGPGAGTSGAYIGGIAEAWTKSFGHINSIANISAGPGGITAHVSSGRFPPGGPRSTLGGNEMWLGNLGAMPDWQKPFAINHVAPHEFGHSLKIDNMPARGKWAGSIMANSANNVSATDLEAVVEACRAVE